MISSISKYINLLYLENIKSYTQQYIPEAAKVLYKNNKSNTECGIIRPTNAIYMRSHLLIGNKAISKCEVNPTSSFQAMAFTINTLHRVQC